MPPDPLLVLVSSPALGPQVWRSTGVELSSRGWAVSHAPRVATAPDTASDFVRALATSIPTDHDVVLVPHSNAGLYVPALAAEHLVVGTVFVDAGLPGDSGPTPLAPPDLYEFLRGLADADGRLPPWTEWWGKTEGEGLFSDAAVRRAVEAEQPQLPLSYFAGSVSGSPGWDDHRCAYLAFGDTYATEREQAAARGWPVRTVPGRHLHMLHDPAGVATAIIELLADCGITR